jgi:DNA-binding IclR family transcriptional regulator
MLTTTRAWRSLGSFTEATMTNPDDLRKRFEKIATDGYVWCDGEYADGLAAVAAPILDPNRRPIGAIHVHGPAYRFPPGGEADAIAAMVVDKTRLITDQVG